MNCNCLVTKNIGRWVSREFIVWTLTCELVATLTFWVFMRKNCCYDARKVIEIFIDQTCALCYHSHFINYFFYHLPTRGRVGIKLGDAWYVSNVSIIFDCWVSREFIVWTLTCELVATITWHSFARRIWAYKQKVHGNLCFPLWRAYLLLLCIYFYAKSQSFPSIPFYFSPLASIMWWGKI